MINKPWEAPDGQLVHVTDQVMALIPGSCQAWETAAAIAFLLGDESRFVTKSQFAIDGGWIGKVFQ